MKTKLVFVLAVLIVIALTPIFLKNNQRTPSSSPLATDTVQSVSTGCKSAGGLPDSVCTPGVINTSVTQENIHSTICVKGFTKTIRPPVSYTSQLKIKQIAEYGYIDTNPASYEEDHLISLELGGSPADPKNLWPEPYDEPNGQGAHEKDQVENLLHQRVCNGIITLKEAQTEISTNWESVK